VRGNRDFVASGASLDLSLLGDELAFAGMSLRRKFPFPAQAETGSMTGWWQSPQTARFPHDVKWDVSAGFPATQFPDFGLVGVRAF